MKKDSFTLSLMKMKSEMNANVRIKIIKNHINDLMNEKLKIKKS